MKNHSLFSYAYVKQCNVVEMVLYEIVDEEVSQNFENKKKV